MSDQARRGPGNRSGNRPSSTRRRGRARTTARPEPAAATATPAPETTDPRPKNTTPSLADRIRRFGLTIATADGIAVLFIITIAVLGATIADAGITPLPAAIAAQWMVLQMSPVIIDSIPLGIVPAVPAALLVVLTAWRIRREVSGPVSVRDIRVLAAVAVGSPVLLTIVAWLMLWDASNVLAVSPPNLLHAVIAAVILRVIALTAGLGPKLLIALLRRRNLPEWPVASLKLATDITLWLWAAGAVVVIASMVWHFSGVRETYAIADGFGAAIGLSVLALLYLPNAAMAAVGVFAGTPASLGMAEVSPFAVVPGHLPPLPVLAAMPQSYHPVAMAILIIPVVVVVWRTRAFIQRTDPRAPYLIAVGAGACAGVLVGAVSWLCSGVVGYYGPSGSDWWLAGVFVSAWVALAAAVVTVVLRGLPRPAVTVEPAEPVAADETDEAETDAEAETDVADEADAEADTVDEAEAVDEEATDATEAEDAAEDTDEADTEPAEPATEDTQDTAEPEADDAPAEPDEQQTDDGDESPNESEK
ncbi:hypothetical protein KRX51_02445 [Corynebacterium sp. TAE3-ERU12]|uniref:cell division protein PerM n=1 Tax=Corynebacterium sp. TAE3-ERU12 TaxID=2849491 RepID=UPI001C43BE9D|nr:hypothetical protein [Corynebacterium sp. TAE3-ERU12]